MAARTEVSNLTEQPEQPEQQEFSTKEHDWYSCCQTSYFELDQEALVNLSRFSERRRYGLWETLREELSGTEQRRFVYLGI